MRVAVVTGASSGLGEEYVRAIARDCPEIEEIWLIARRRERLEALAETIAKKTRVIALDLSTQASLDEYAGLLKASEPDVRLLVNNAGYGKLGDFIEQPQTDSVGMVKLNCWSLTGMTSLTLPYMHSGAGILNVCSIAAFVPNPRMAVYSSTKAYVLSFSKALGFELKARGIHVLAACPAPMDTEFLAVANVPGHSKTFEQLPRVQPAVMAKKSLAALRKGRSVYTNRVLYKVYRVLSKIVPDSLLMHVAKC